MKAPFWGKIVDHRQIKVTRYINVEILTAHFVNRVIVIKFNKSKATLLPSGLVGDNANILYISIVREVLSKLFIIMVVFYSTNEQLSYSCTSLGVFDILPGYCSFGFYQAEIDYMLNMNR